MCWARTGPTPGSVSSRVTVALLRLTWPPGAPAPPPEPASTAPGGGVAPITTSSPSTSLRARFRNDRSVPGSAPPAASRASATRDPAGRRTSPGLRTRPATATTTKPLGTTADGTAGDCATAATGSGPGPAPPAGAPPRRAARGAPRLAHPAAESWRRRRDGRRGRFGRRGVGHGRVEHRRPPGRLDGQVDGGGGGAAGRTHLLLDDDARLAQAQ